MKPIVHLVVEDLPFKKNRIPFAYFVCDGSRCQYVDYGDKKHRALRNPVSGPGQFYVHLSSNGRWHSFLSDYVTCPNCLK